MLLCSLYFSEMSICPFRVSSLDVTGEQISVKIFTAHDIPNKD